MAKKADGKMTAPVKKGGSGAKKSPVETPPRAHVTATYFAERSFKWGAGTLGKDAGYLHGSVAISPADLGPSPMYGRIFDLGFRRSMTQLQEYGVLRRAGHSFHTERESTPFSYLVHGKITEGSSSTSLIGVEAHTYGAVTVYFREETKAATIDELLGWWIYGSMWMALAVHALLGTRGPAHAAVLVDLAGVADLPTPTSGRLVTSLHGPFALEPPLVEDEDAAHRWARKPAEAPLTSIRADILQQSLGRRWVLDAGEEGEWTPWDARQSVAYGRSVPTKRR